MQRRDFLQTFIAAIASTALAATAGEKLAAAARAQSELVAGFDYLARLPLSNAQIAMELAAALENWSAFEAVRADLSATSRREELAGLSEALLGNFDRLTDHLERGMHALIY